ncbi:hypothetical protein QNH48_15055 [Neobacillus sp. YX16]|uniref:hypothetical protein n=1 Tax=Neobacillus sp. YX16 TaxID=3047874 RepID=UPI0024C3BEE8|nr:hypothetical protein [Neobacillus sp. YX16]WHZ05858.1 hypothetical protein QNH48_15055 [Neobacillus sp. YX16]
MRRPEPVKIRVTDTLWLTAKEIEEQLAELEQAWFLVAHNRTLEYYQVQRITLHLEAEIKRLKGILKYDEYF